MGAAWQSDIPLSVRCDARKLVATFGTSASEGQARNVNNGDSSDQNSISPSTSLMESNDHNLLQNILRSKRCATDSRAEFSAALAVCRPLVSELPQIVRSPSFLNAANQQYNVEQQESVAPLLSETLNFQTVESMSNSQQCRTQQQQPPGVAEELTLDSYVNLFQQQTVWYEFLNHETPVQPPLQVYYREHDVIGAEPLWIKKLS